MDFSGLREVGDAGVRAEENVGRVKGAFVETPLALREVNSSEGSLWEVVGRYESQAVQPDLMDRVDSLEDSRHPLETLYSFEDVRFICLRSTSSFTSPMILYLMQNSLEPNFSKNE